LFSSVLDIRDPIFGFIAIVLIMFIASFLTYTFNIFQERKSRKEYRKLLKKFELNNLEEKDYIHLYTTYNLPFDSILLLASSFLHKGEYSKVIGVYLSLLEHINDKTKKEELLELLGSAYYKSGFLQRSEDIYLKILKFSPHNIVALQALLIINEKLQKYKNCLDVLESLYELNVNTIREHIYIKTLKLLDDPICNFDEKTIKLNSIYESNRIIERLFLEFLLKYNKKYFWNNINSFSLLNIIDLLWYLDFDDIDFDKIKGDKLLEDLYTAKGYMNNSKQSNVFEFNVLIATNDYEKDINIDLNFEFLCTQCKKVHPIYVSRCPHCNSILTLKVKPNLAKAHYEKNLSFQ
jgi:tetratricopeptide (TPR) repeat protein